ncbi:MAG: PglZ domain-containing protein, partial [Deltaproteobacteria bacterium]|nr:PglZ domain-containing protein [Deltaproteobacteria bacterium]
PEGDGEAYQALCRQAAPDLAIQIDRLFADGTPDFETINNLIAVGANWPKLKTLLKAESPVEILVAIMSPSKIQKKSLTGDIAWLSEFKQFLKTTIGITLKTKSSKFAAINRELWRLVLFSEFVFDLPGNLPDSLKDVPRAAKTYIDLINTVCDVLRDSEKHQMVYMKMADQTTDDLSLEKHMAGIANLGVRDTFAFEERNYLKVFVDAILEGKFDLATEAISNRTRSIWVRFISERQQLWTIADRGLELIRTAQDLKNALNGLRQDLEPIVDFYCDHFRRLDRCHREFEQSVADVFGEFDVLEPVVDMARKRYLETAEFLQSMFTAVVKAEGWPVSGRIRNSEVFDRFVAPWLKERKKMAYFLVDALRYELAVELENELSASFRTQIKPVCAQLPTVTSVGMAALMPEANGYLKLVLEKDDLYPYVKGQKVLVPKDRYEYIRKHFGDRCHMRDLDELVEKPKIRFPETTQLLIVKTADIDKIGETHPLEARRMIPGLVRKIITGVNRVQDKGFNQVVIATDHGFVLLDEQQAGDTVSKPPGEWIAIKDRCLLGKGSSGDGVLVFNKTEVGIQGDFEDYIVPRSFGTFKKGHPYFHGGLSLQECILPVISVDFETKKAERFSTSIDISLSYKGASTNKITTRRPMIEISMFSTMFDEIVEFQLEAYSQDGLVGEVAASPHVNAATNLVEIQPGQAIKVPLKMDDDYHGSFEVRAIDPMTQVNYATLKLKTDYVD